MQRSSFTGHVVDTDGLLEMLIMRHHLREKRPLCHSHHGGLLLIIRLQGRGKKRRQRGKHSQRGADRGGRRAPNIKTLFVKMKTEDEVAAPRASPCRALKPRAREKPSEPNERRLND